MRLEGQQIGRYYFRQFIGTGGTGDVYLAEDPRIQQQVAIKVIQVGDLTFSPVNQGNNLARFRQEAAAIAKLNHPHIVHLNDYNEAVVAGTKIIYIVCPYYKAGSFANWLRGRSSNSLSLQDVADIIRQAADALQYTHQHHIIHQDIKPSNFLIDNEENPKRPNLLLTDFGISKFSDAATYAATSPSLGTLTYMAPEQINGRPTYASDQYALAVMTYELLTGRPPFQGPPQVAMNQHFNAQPQPPSALNPGIPKAIDSVILRALAKRPEDRFDSVAAFAYAFQQGLQRSDVFPQTPPRGKDINQIPPPPPAPNFTGRGAYSNAVPRPAHMVNVPPQQKLGPSARTILLAVLALVIILGGVGAFLVINNNQNAQQNINATATAQANINTLATASAQANLTATTIASNYPFSVNLKLNDPLSDNTKGNGWKIINNFCEFLGNSYHVLAPQTNTFTPCFAVNTNFSNFTFEVEASLLRGDGIGITFRGNADKSQLYSFVIYANGRYAINVYVDTTGTNSRTLKSGSLPKTPNLNDTNTIAVVARGTTLTLYFNQKEVDSTTDGTYSHGQIGCGAINLTYSAEAVFTNAKVWQLP